MAKTKKARAPLAAGTDGAVRVIPFTSGPGIFAADGKTVEVIGVGSGHVMGFKFSTKSPEQAEVTVLYLREQLMTDTPEANALRKENSYQNAVRFVRSVLSPEALAKRKRERKPANPAKTTA